MADQAQFTRSLRKFVGRTEIWASVVIVTPSILVTFAHGPHALWKVGDVQDVYVEIDSQEVCIKALVIVWNPQKDVVLLRVQDGVVLQAPKLQEFPPMQGQRYVLLGRSGQGTVNNSSMTHGIIATESHDDKGLYFGDSGCLNGDSGGGVFTDPGKELMGVIIGVFQPDPSFNRRAVIVPLSTVDRLLVEYSWTAPAQQLMTPAAVITQPPVVMSPANTFRCAFQGNPETVPSAHAGVQCAIIVHRPTATPPWNRRADHAAVEPPEL